MKFCMEENLKMKMTSKWRQPQNEDNLKNEDKLKNENNLENEDYIQNKTTF